MSSIALKEHEIPTEMNVAALTEPLSQAERIALERLVASWLFTLYRHMRAFDPALMRGQIREQLLAALGDQAVFVVGAWRGDELVGVIDVAPAPWDTDHFGMRMSEVRHLITTGTAAQRQAIAEALLGACLDAGAGHVDHLSCRVDAEDSPTIHALEQRGFRLVETMLSYLFPCQSVGKIGRAFRPRYPVRPLTPDDVEPVVEIMRHSGFKGRFHNDPDIDQGKADEMYLRWVKASCDGTMADEVQVAEYRGRVVGFISYQRLRVLEQATGLKVSGRGLLCVVPEHGAAAVDLVRTSLIHVGRYVDFGQFDIRLTNPPILRLYGALQMRLAHVRHVFHARQREGADHL